MEQIQQKNGLGQFSCHIAIVKQARLIQASQGEKMGKKPQPRKGKKKGMFWCFQLVALWPMSVVQNWSIILKAASD